MDFTAFVLQELPQPPARIIEIGCGDEGGLVPALVAAGYDAIGVDPRAPAGERFRQCDFREVTGAFDAAVAGRVVHHLFPLGEALDHLAALAPVVVVDEFAWDIIDPELQAWYEAHHRPSSPGPASLAEWRSRHAHELHAHDAVLAALRARWDERVLNWVPYFPRWLATDEESPDRIGFQWAGANTSTTRSAAASR